MEALKGTSIEDVEVDISLAKPQSENKTKKKVTTKHGMPMNGPRNFGGPTGNPRGGRGGGFSGPGGFGKPYAGGYESGAYPPYGGGYQPGPPQGGYYDPYAYSDPYAQNYGAPAYGGGVCFFLS